MIFFVAPESGTGNSGESPTPPGTPDVDRLNGGTNNHVQKQKKKRHSIADLYKGPDGMDIPKDIISRITTFSRKLKKVSLKGSAKVD